jgi:hypothetical protein
MNGQKPNVFMPALIGGVVAGILSGSPLFCLCCLWIIGGASLASYLAAKDSPVSLKAGDGALVGAFTGIFAAVIQAVVSIPFQAFNLGLLRKLMERLAEYSPNLPSGWDKWYSGGSGPFSLAWFLFGLVVSAAIFAVLGALGGIIGMALFGKKTPPPGQGIKNETPQDAGHSQS